ncbi:MULTISPECIES: tyrosine-type recombinase/integrase [Parachlamydia]|uniref:Tyr recombinase domain-containing protein n=1 Tax=Parachlamydia acanthamoebae (strain UV7) TaxID=765952 RepID=F8L1I1_PARAV|nr:tyrosine-type recombinase/integrase [Parachlamydia acanthamoebae]CCB87123.1 putative uncharacterized protein [Parachlamydia acanthamoebae UV-7]
MCKLSDSTYLFVIVVLALSTGMRKGRNIKSKMEDIDFQRNLIIIQTTKNGAVRMALLVGLSYELLKNLDSNGKSNLVFPSIG